MVNSPNTGFRSFVDHQDAENRAIDAENVTETQSNQMSPKTPLRQSNPVSPVVSVADARLPTARTKSQDEETATVAPLLDYSHCTVTSYTPKASGNCAVVTTPSSCYGTPTNAALQSIDSTDNAHNNLMESFCFIQPPATPTNSNMKNMSTHLIDLTTPDVFHTPPEIIKSVTTVVGQTSLLKSAVKNSAQIAIGGTPKRKIQNATKTNILQAIATQGDSTSAGTSVTGSAKKNAASLLSQRSTPKRIFTMSSTNTPTKAFFAAANKMTVATTPKNTKNSAGTPSRGMCFMAIVFLVAF